MTQKQQKHMSKKELNEDPFFEEVAHIIDFLRKHQNLLIAILAVVLVAVVGIFGGKALSRQQNEKASGNFGIAMDYYNKGQLVEADDQFMLVAEQYKKNDWGKRAYYYLGLTAQGLDKSDEEILDYLETFVKTDLNDPALKASAYQLIGTYYYRNGDMVSAGENYFKATKKALGQSTKITLGIRAGEAFADAGAVDRVDAVIKYLGTLDLSSADKLRVEALAVR
jgi:predicted negative regulator of RcsB-dependent stress response